MYYYYYYNIQQNIVVCFTYPETFTPHKAMLF